MMISVNYIAFSFVVGVVSPLLFLLVDGTDETYDDQLLESYRLCLADNRGGIYWQDSDVRGILCRFAWTDGAREVRCEWNGAGSVRTTYRLDPNATLPPPRLPNCGLARRIEVESNDQEVFIADLDPGLPSSVDRAFVMNTLAPLIEGGPEKYKAYIHERSFALGSHIETNIVEAIEKSRHALLVVSQAFLRSEFCKHEFDMVTHRAFDGHQGYMVILRFGPLRKETLPRPLRLYMSTKTFLEWPDDPSQLDALEVRKRLVNALGRSLYQRGQKEVGEKHEAQTEVPNYDPEFITWSNQNP